MTREEAIRILSTRDRFGVPCGYTSGVPEALDMAIEALAEAEKREQYGQNYESESEVRLAVVNRYKDRVILFDPFGEEEYLPPSADQVTSKLQSVEISTDKGDRSTMSQPNGKLDLWKGYYNNAYMDGFMAKVEDAIVHCKDCKFKSLHDDGNTKYYYCALEDRPNRQWSVDDTDYCSWGEKGGND